jgi:hypothetical protein
MTHGFNVNDDLVCEGIIGDGCGGGRIFYVKDEALLTYDPLTQKSLLLLKAVKNAQKISKKACIISIECADEVIKLDLSTIKE